MAYVVTFGFSSQDRSENIRRIAEVAKLFNDAGLIIITAFISPFRKDRQMAKEIIGPDRFLEVYLDISLSVCEARDPKDMYKKARSGVVREFTGIDSPYESPVSPSLSLPTSEIGPEQCIEKLMALVCTALKQGE